MNFTQSNIACLNQDSCMLKEFQVCYKQYKGQHICCAARVCVCGWNQEIDLIKVTNEN